VTALAAVVSALHLLALAIGLPAVALRGSALGGPLDAPGLRRVFVADAAWGIAAILWLATGLVRAFGPLEKGPAFYVHSRFFMLKMALFLLVFLIELLPMTGLIRWRLALSRGESPDLGRAPLFARLSRIEAGLVLAIVFVASFMARGFGMGR